MGRFARFVIGAGAAAFALASDPVPAPAQVTMKIGTATANDAQHEWIKLYKARLEKRAGDRLKVEIYPAGQLGSIPSMVQGLQLGTVEGFISPTDFFAGVDPRYAILSGPGLFRDSAHAFATLTDPALNARILALGDDKGIKGVTVFAIGVPAYISKRPIRTLADFRGQKIRVNATRIEQEAMRRLGAAGAPMPLSEVQPALQQGVIDGSKSIISIFVVGKYESMAKAVTVTNDSVLVSLGAVSKPWLDKLPEDLRRIVIEEGQAVHKEAQDWTHQFSVGLFAKWREAGGEVIDLPAADRDEMVRRIGPIVDEVARENAAVKELYDLVIATAKKAS